MGIKNWVRLRAPNASQLDSLAQQKLKTLHPKKAAETWLHRSVQRLKKFGVWLTSFRSNLGSRIPGVQLRTRNVVTRNIDNFMTGQGIQAQSSTGVSLEPEDKKFAIEELGTGAVFDNEKLMELDKATLKKVEDEFDDVNKQYTREVVAYDRKQQTGQLTEDDITRVDEMKTEFRAARDRFTRTTALAIKLDMSRMNEKLRSATSMQHLLKAQARAMALNPEDFSDSFLVARLNVASFDSAQRDIDRRIVELGENYRKMVYEDVVEFLDAKDGDFFKLVDEQKRHNLIKGTGKLEASTHGVRLPGLDWYVKRAKADLKDNPEFSDMDVLQKGAAIMYKDWSLFHDQVQARIDTIRQDNESEGGSFNPDDMTAYHHAKSYMATLEWLEELGGTDKQTKINKDALYNVTADYGDELGFGLRADRVAGEAAVLAKYGMSSFDRDYLSDKLPGGVPKPAVGASSKDKAVAIDKDIVKSKLVDDSLPDTGRGTPPPPYTPTPSESLSRIDELSGINFDAPSSPPLTSPSSNTGTGDEGSGGSEDLISLNDNTSNN